jgi:probable HAF family extracellular repeat protein
VLIFFLTKKESNMATSRYLNRAQQYAAVAAIAILSACQSNGLTPPQNSTFQASSPQSVAPAQHLQPKTTGYTVSELPTLGGTYGVGDGINNKGRIAGQASLASGDFHATRWTNGKFKDLGTLGGPNSYIPFPNKSNAGDFAGASDSSITDPYGENFCGDNVPQTCLPFTWRAGVMTALATLGGNNGQADGNNSRGDIVGFAETGTHDPSCVSPQVFDIGATLWNRGTNLVTQLPALPGDIVAAAIAVNDRGDVVGASGPTCGSPSFQLLAHPVLWPKHGSPIGLQTLGGAYNSTATAINNHRDIAGFSDLPGDTAMHAVLWKKGSTEPTDLGTLPGDVSSMVFGMNDKGQIVGTSTDASGNSRAVLWEDGTIYDLNTLIPPSSNLDLFYGGDINDAGVIVGEAMDTTTGNTPAFVANPQHGKLQEPTPRQKVVLPQALREQLMRGGLGRFHFGLIRR